MPKSKKIPEINAGSMADIAFLLLVFFLVTTTMNQDIGLRVSLPQWVDVPPDPKPKNKRNVLDVVITKNDQLFVNGEKFDVENVREKTIRFVTNNGRDANMSQSPLHAIVSVTNDNGTSYDMYLRVNNELYAAYNGIWNEASKNEFGKPWERLNEEEQKGIKLKYPRVISEADTKFD